MNTAISKLSSREALKNSLPFLLEFVKKYWILVGLYIIGLAIPDLMFNFHDQPFSEIILDRRFLLWAVIITIPSMLITNYAIQMALVKLELSAQKLNEPLLKSLWRIFCLGVIKFSISMPLFIFLLIPGFWWLVKTSVSLPNLLSTDDGPVESIRKSHQLINNRFWQCFKYWFGTLTIAILCTIIPFVVLLVLIAICIQVVAPHSITWSGMGPIIRGINSMIRGVFEIIFLFCQAWLYLYLKSQNQFQTKPN